MWEVSSKDGNSYFFQIYCSQKVLSKSSRNLIHCGISNMYLCPEEMGRMVLASSSLLIGIIQRCQGKTPFSAHKEILALLQCSYVFSSVSIPFWQITFGQTTVHCVKVAHSYFFSEATGQESAGNNSVTCRPTRAQINELRAKG